MQFKKEAIYSKFVTKFAAEKVHCPVQTFVSQEARNKRQFLDDDKLQIADDTACFNSFRISFLV